MQRTPVIVVLFRTEEAWALAQLLKRVSLKDCQRFAVDLDQALLMQDALQVLRAELARAGYPPYKGRRKRNTEVPAAQPVPTRRNAG